MPITEELTSEKVLAAIYEDELFDDWVNEFLVPVTNEVARESVHMDEIHEMVDSDDPATLASAQGLLEQLRDSFAFAHEVLDIQKDFQSIALMRIKAQAEEADLPNAVGQAYMVNDIIRSYLVNTLPLFEVYVATVVEAAFDQEESDA